MQKMRKTLRVKLAAWRFYSRFLTAHWKKLAFPIIASAGISLIVLPLAYLVVHLFQEAIPSGSIREVAKTGLVLVFLTFFQGVVAYWIRSSVLSVVKISVEQFRDEVVKRLCAISRSEYIRSNRGELHSKIIHDTEQLDNLGIILLVHVMPAVAVIVPLSFALVWLNWYLFLISFAVFPVMIYLGKIIGRRMDHRIKTFRTALHSFSSGILSTLNTMDLARIQSAEEFELEQQRRRISKVREEGRYLAKVNMTYQVVQSTVATSFSFLVLVIGGIAVIRGFFSIGALVSFYVVMTLLKAQVNIIVFLIPQLVQAKDSLTELYNFLSIEEAKPYEGKNRISFKGNVQIEKLFFSYDDRPVLQNVNLSIPAGKIVVIQGANGSGKSTLVSLILGLHRPLNGELYADGHPYGELDMVHFRRQMGVVMQDPMIFTGSIQDNLTYGSNDYTIEQIEESAEISTAQEFIKDLPDGYKTEVGERGVLLSGGQCQRIAIARALLRRPRLLILDEPTTHIDIPNIRLLMQNLREISPSPAILLVGHDPIILDYADEVYTLQRGMLSV